MLIDVTKQLKNFEGDVLFLNVAEKTPKEMTIRNVTVTMLSAAVRDERLPPDEMLNRFILAQRIHENDKVELDVDELALILELTAVSFTPLVYGRMVELLDPAKLKK